MIIASLRESPTTRRAGGLDFSAIGGKKQRHGSALIGAGVTGCKAPGLKTPNHFRKDHPVSQLNGIIYKKIDKTGKKNNPGIVRKSEAWHGVSAL